MEFDFKGRIYILRHGQTECNRNGLWYCPPESHINDEGVRQAEEVRSVIEKISPEKIYCSPYQRCVDTSKVIMENYSDADFKIHQCLGERNFKGVEGLDSNGIMDRFNISMDHSPITRNIDHVPGIEASSSFHQRVNACFGQIMSDSRECKNLLIVSHGGVMWSLVYQKLLLTPKPRTFLNCALLGVDFRNGTFEPFFSMNMRTDWYSDINPSWSSLQL